RTPPGNPEYRLDTTALMVGAIRSDPMATRAGARNTTAQNSSLRRRSWRLGAGEAPRRRCAPEGAALTADDERLISAVASGVSGTGPRPSRAPTTRTRARLPGRHRWRRRRRRGR